MNMILTVNSCVHNPSPRVHRFPFFTFRCKREVTFFYDDDAIFTRVRWGTRGFDSNCSSIKRKRRKAQLLLSLLTISFTDLHLAPTITYRRRPFLSIPLSLPRSTNRQSRFTSLRRRFDDSLVFFFQRERRSRAPRRTCPF